MSLSCPRGVVGRRRRRRHDPSRRRPGPDIPSSSAADLDAARRAGASEPIPGWPTRPCGLPERPGGRQPAGVPGLGPVFGSRLLRWPGVRVGGRLIPMIRVPPSATVTADRGCGLSDPGIMMVRQPGPAETTVPSESLVTARLARRRP